MTEKCFDCMVDMNEDPEFASREPGLFEGEWTHWTCPKCNKGKHKRGKSMIPQTVEDLGKIAQGMEERKAQIAELVNNDEAVKKYLKLSEDQNLDGKLMETWADTICGKITEWTPAPKGKSATHMEGIVEVTRSTRSNRRIIPKIIVEKQPFLIAMLVETGKVKINLKDIEPELTAGEVEELVETTNSHSYKIEVHAQAPAEPEKKKRNRKTRKIPEELNASPTI